ncbi:hypothetical protein DES53_105159 [Roseimicrobium gellanilyticum]|uniref:Uncharacterized protein n=1 Tax=Roseimicrobium gellanilyticum TaxID=748857 RepID=A0A366HLE8_9BACT|nr:hypothetical protein DES53_105159 [Roseimicrobium gellanilyticum]
MKKGLLSFSAFLFALVAVPQAQAWVGGPFDSGDYNILHEREGVYQATMTYKNGSGFCQFSQDNALGAQSTAAGSPGLSVFSLENRSLLYYKGITYAGVATGVVDFESRKVHGFTNGSTTVQTTITGGTGGGSASDYVVVNGNEPDPGFGFSNSQFTAKITRMAPLLRFQGKGEASFFIDPQVEDLRDVVTTAIGTIDFDAFVDPLTDSFNTAALADIIHAAIDLYKEIDDASSPANNIEFVKTKVFGSRRYF